MLRPCIALYAFFRYFPILFFVNCFDNTASLTADTTWGILCLLLGARRRLHSDHYAYGSDTPHRIGFYSALLGLMLTFSHVSLVTKVCLLEQSVVKPDGLYITAMQHYLSGGRQHRHNFAVIQSQMITWFLNHQFNSCSTLASVASAPCSTYRLQFSFHCRIRVVYILAELAGGFMFPLLQKLRQPGKQVLFRKVITIAPVCAALVGRYSTSLPKNLLCVLWGIILFLLKAFAFISLQ